MTLGLRGVLTTRGLTMRDLDLRDVEDLLVARDVEGLLVDVVVVVFLVLGIVNGTVVGITGIRFLLTSL